MEDVTGGQVRLVPGTEANPNQAMGTLSTYDVDGNPITLLNEEDGLNLDLITIGSAIGTVGKTTTADEPDTNTLVPIKFTNGNSAAGVTIAFNGGTARVIQFSGAVVAAAELALVANGVALFFFDGTILHQVGIYT